MEQNSVRWRLEHKPAPPAQLDPSIAQAKATADAEAARLDKLERLRATAQRHRRQRGTLTEYLETIQPRTRDTVMSRVLRNPKWTPDQIDSGEAFGEEYDEYLAEYRQTNGRYPEEE